jgi:hypothetical protein
MAEVNLTQLAYLEWQKTAELERQKEVKRSRDYYEGEQVITLTARMLKLLGLTAADKMTYRLNIIRTIVRAITERLSVQGFDSNDDTIRTWAEATWRANLLNIKQDSIYDGSVNEGESFVLVDWVEGGQYARFIPHPRYVDPQADGDGFGCKVMYENDDINQPVMYAVKRWREELGQGKVRSRLTRYYPDRIEKYALDGEWKPFKDDGDTAWPIPWVDKGGLPLGVPVFHFMNPDERPEAIDAWGPQDGLINAFVDLMAGNRVGAFRILVALGFVPTTDGKPLNADASNALQVEPGMVLGTTKGPNEVSFNALEGTTPTAFLETLDKIIYFAAITTDTPISRFQITGQVSSAETQKEYGKPLVGKIEKRQERFGAAWADAMMMALKLHRLYGQNAPAETQDQSPLYARWLPAQERTLADRQTQTTAMKAAGFPEEEIWRQAWDYSDQEIAELKKEDSYQRKVAQTNVLGTFGNG